MKIFEGLESISSPFAESVVAIGTFDGVHVGHRAIISGAVEEARRTGRPALVFTFDRHPSELLAPERAPHYITSPGQRDELVAALGTDGLVIARFDEALSQLSPDEFVERILKRLLGARAIVEGSSFCFGRGRAGDVAYLTGVQERYDFRLIAVEPVVVDGAPASSTRVRELIAAGRVGEAERVLGHPFRLCGRVVAGQRLGRTLGFPTANLDILYRQIYPADGVYAVHARLDDGRLLSGACSIGVRPTVNGAGRTVEVYLFDFDEQIYGRQIEVRFLERLREERKFDSLDALKSQMVLDVEQARAICGRGSGG
jgi:riboflavin kinase/FMN adenylyltransferase